jgi:diguanylate cyclase (GGDEF)-like protein
VDQLHLPSLLFVVSVGATCTAGLLARQLFVGRGGQHMVIWSVAFGFAGVGSLIQAFRATLPKILVVGVSNALLVLTVALVWAGFRAFDHRPVRAGWTVAGSALWVAACLFPPFYASFEARLSLVSVLMASYSVAAFVHQARMRALDPLPARSTLMLLLGTHAAVIAARVPMLFLFPVAEVNGSLHAGWIGLFGAEAVVHAFLIVVAILALVQDRVERDVRHAAETDALTGLANRRAFVAAASERLATGARGALLLIDIDHFKAINDSHGHQAGDDVLSGFAARAGSVLPPGPLFGRIGGEEFGVFLSGVDHAEAVAIAQQVRESVAARPFTTMVRPVHVTVSIGVAVTTGVDTAFDRLFADADAALYRAKSAGRNRVQTHDRPPRRAVVALQAVAG